MRLTSTTAATILAYASYVEAQNGIQCHARNPGVNGAISDFCSKKDIVVPSDYATRGKQNMYALVNIDGGRCNPPAWVPQNYCNIQMWTICAHGDVNGAGYRSYGKDGCQRWQIQSTHHPKVPDPPKKPKKKKDKKKNGFIDAVNRKKNKKKKKKKKGKKEKKPKRDLDGVEGMGEEEDDEGFEDVIEVGVEE
ncbi:unnamed protein product [Zymoseptoria tritici ST99CH_1A5]|uniref:Secreted protein n=1 Tax=Zymoseptoria tritici ST99CH_1A5 TaxID=1276529 RepID=A0A1Y6LPT7_ZYMTR|nr:unnamed protein product [Zymoseptoria tritici ST99CH_3D1]SMY26416.1 unnamed protein product [Zymoseptoria tritici ST99CH_1A5]